MKKRFFTFLVLFLLSVSLLTQASLAKADDLVIQDDGKIVLVVTDDGVLGVSTTASKGTAKTAAPAPQTHSAQQQNSSPQHTEQKQQSAPSASTKTVPLVPSHTESSVKINPPVNNDKKIQVTITTQSTPPPASVKPLIIAAPTTTQGNAQQAPQFISNSAIASPTIVINSLSKTQQTVVTQPNATGIPTIAPSPLVQPTVMTKTVDQVVAQGSNGQPVITIKSDQAHQLTIQQGSTQVTTSLPLQINTLTHALSIPSQNKSATINVLPTEAMQGILNKELLNIKDLNQAKIDLTKDASGLNYTVNTQKQGKLFGIFPVQSPIQVKLSAQNGKLINVAQSGLFSIFGGFIK